MDENKPETTELAMVDDIPGPDAKSTCLEATVDGTSRLFGDDGRLRLVPRPSSNSNDPLTLPTWRKLMATIALCYFGALGISTQQIFAGLLPVFMLEYAGLDLHLLDQPGGLVGIFAGAAGGDMGGHFPPAGTAVPLGGAMPGPPSGVASGVNPLDALSSIPGAQPLSRVNLLVSLPMLVIGLSNYVLVPATAAFGRRAVMIFCGVLSTACTLWAGFSTSLESHLAARCLQGLGAGCVETVIRLIIQDITFLHQRSSYLGTIWAFQGIVALPLGIGSSHIVANMGWRWLYFLLAVLTALGLLMVLFFVPETRWHRTHEELTKAFPSPRGFHAGRLLMADNGTGGEGQEDDGEQPALAGRRISNRTKYGLCAHGGINLKGGLLTIQAVARTLALPMIG